MNRVAVLGTTTWGVTLAVMLARTNIPVTLVGRTRPEAEEAQRTRRCARLLPPMAFPDSLVVDWDVRRALRGADMVVIAVPCNSFRDNVRRLIPGLDESQPVVLSASKGLEAGTGKRMSQVLAEEFPPSLHDGICVLSGPNLAPEIAEGKPASTVVASEDQQVSSAVQAVLMSPTFRVYTNRDVVGVELGGALKNIVALGAGISDGLGYGDNGKAAFITRGLAEITRFGVAAGGDPLTFAGLAGLGDLMATCSSLYSRNRYVGLQLAGGRPLKEILASMKNVAEGVYTTPAAIKMAAELGVEMPITEMTCQVLYEGLDPRQAVVELMGRPPRSEMEGFR